MHAISFFFQLSEFNLKKIIFRRIIRLVNSINFGNIYTMKIIFETVSF